MSDKVNQKTKQKSLSEKVKMLFDEASQVKVMSIGAVAGLVEIFYIEQITDKKLISENIISPLSKLEPAQQNQSKKSAKELHKNVKKSQNNKKNSKTAEIFAKITLPSGEEVFSEAEIIEKIYNGAAVVVYENQAMAYPVLAAEKRSIQEPPTSRVVKGPREGFVEDIGANLGLVRKRIKTPDLKIEDIFVGKQTRTKVSVVYLKDIAKDDIVQIVKERLCQIDVDGIVDSYYIESFLEENKFKFFRRVGNTEKPDVLVSKILEGRVGILVDGSPIALTVPFVLMEDLQSPEDYYSIPTFASFARIMRFIGLIFAILVPGIYVALQSFNYRILPINFLITLLSSIEGLSVPPLIEILLVLFLFEIITEASLQMPNSLGMALSIIGALALGNTAVDAGIISPPSIVIVAISSVALYIIPNQIAETRLLRLLFTTIGGIVGLYGIVTSFIILTAYLCSVTSFGVPYLAPLAPSVKADKKDAFIKQSIQEMTTRPKLIVGKNKTRLRLKESDKKISQKQKETQQKYMQKPKNSGAITPKEGKSDI